MDIRILILWSAAMLGAVPVQLFKQGYKKYTTYILAFSGGMLLSVLCVKLLPFIFTNAANATTAGAFLLAGFIVQVLIEHITMGAEHGHLHTHGHSKLQYVMLIIGMSFHSLTDGIPLSLPSSIFDTRGYLAAISLHKIPEGFVLMMLFTMLFNKGAKAWIAMALYAAISPLAMVLAGQFMATAWTAYVIALIAGGLFHVTTTILFENNPDVDHHHFNPLKWLAILAGISIALLL